MEEVIYSLDGINGQLYLYNNRVVIKRNGFAAKMMQGFFKGEKDLLISSISGIQIKKGTLLTNGYIQFTLKGGNESTKGIFDATHDENSVMFAKANNDLVETIKNKIYELMKQPLQESTKQSYSVADEILKFKSLFDLGVITQAEFEEKKAQLLNM